MSILTFVKNKIRQRINPPLHSPDYEAASRFLGSAYGGWPLLETTQRGAILFSFGLGEDITFDLAAIDKFGVSVFGFDPTPKSAGWIKRQQLPKAFNFHQVGIADFDGSAEFFPPENDKHVSFSATPSNSTSVPIKAEVLRLSTLIERIGVGTPDVLKMDIEGFEYAVIADVLSKSDIRPKQLLVEFHHGMYGIENYRTIEAVDQIKKAGYRLFFVSSVGREYGFVFGP